MGLPVTTMAGSLAETVVVADGVLVLGNVEVSEAPEVVGGAVASLMTKTMVTGVAVEVAENRATVGLEVPEAQAMIGLGVLEAQAMIGLGLLEAQVMIG